MLQFTTGKLHMSENHMVTSDKHADQVLKRNISVYKKPAGLHIDEWSWVIQGRLSSRNHSACPWRLPQTSSAIPAPASEVHVDNRHGAPRPGTASRQPPFLRCASPLKLNERRFFALSGPDPPLRLPSISARDVQSRTHPAWNATVQY